MKIKSILITGDDGYNAAGIRILTRHFRTKYEVYVAGTATQQSGMGGKLTMHAKIPFEVKEVEGTTALCVHGSPVDTVECAHAYFSKSFDLVISGINWGANIGPSFITSGTMAAALRPHGIGMTRYSISISWDMPPELWQVDHRSITSIDDYMEYPGLTAAKLIETAISKDLWGAHLLNINLPQKQTKKIVFTSLLKDHTRLYKYPGILRSNTFEYTKSFSPNPETRLTIDAGAVKSGYISITPCVVDITDLKTLGKYKKAGFDMAAQNRNSSSL